MINYEKIFGYWEKIYPYIFVLMTVFLLCKYQPFIADKKMDALLSASINVSAIFMGFLGTSKAMLLSFRSAKTHWLSKNPQGWNLLLSYFRHAILFSLFLCLLSFLMTGLYLPEEFSKFNYYIFVLWAAVLVGALASFYRVLGIFFTLLK